MTCAISHFQVGRFFQLNSLVSLLVYSYPWNEIHKWKNYIQDILKIYIINSIAKSYILNINIRPLVTEYALKSKLVDGTSSAYTCNPYAYFGHSWSYFDIQNLRLVILYIFIEQLGFHQRVHFFISSSILESLDAYFPSWTMSFAHTWAAKKTMFFSMIIPSSSCPVSQYFLTSADTLGRFTTRSNIYSY